MTTSWRAAASLRWKRPCKVRRLIGVHADIALISLAETDEIDLVLSHARDEDRLDDPIDLPHTNLV